MSEHLNLFVSPHAIGQFQNRIAPVDITKARRFIVAGILQATNIKQLPDTGAIRIRTRRPFPFEFRAYCVFDEARGHYVVTTIVRGDSRARRDERRKSMKTEASPMHNQTGFPQDWGPDDFAPI